jgi:hypothetical protein
MDHKLILTVPENIYEPLSETARQSGQTPEELAIQWLATAVQNVVDDPVEEFIGAFSSAIPEWPDEHDRLIGQALRRKMDNSDDQGK